MLMLMLMLKMTLMMVMMVMVMMVTLMQHNGGMAAADLQKKSELAIARGPNSSKPRSKLRVNNDPPQ